MGDFNCILYLIFIIASEDIGTAASAAAAELGRSNNEGVFIEFLALSISDYSTKESS